MFALRDGRSSQGELAMERPPLCTNSVRSLFRTSFMRKPDTKETLNLEHKNFELISSIYLTNHKKYAATTHYSVVSEPNGFHQEK